MGVEVQPSLQGRMLQGDGVFKRKASTDVLRCGGLVTSSPVYIQGTQSCGSTNSSASSAARKMSTDPQSPTTHPPLCANSPRRCVPRVHFRKTSRPACRSTLVYPWKLSKIRAHSRHAQCVYLVSQKHLLCGADLPDHPDGLKRVRHAEPPALVQDAP